LKLRGILVIGFVTRVLLIPFFAHPFDVYAWYTICQSILQEGPYVVSYFPPMMFYTLGPIAYLYSWFSKAFSIEPIPMKSVPPELELGTSWGIEVVPGMLFNTLVKIPFLISDLVVAILLYKIIADVTSNRTSASRASALWFLNPYLIWISSGWGMFDSIPALLSLASFYLLLKKKIGLSSASLAGAVAYKLYPLLFLVPTAFYIRRTLDKPLFQRTIVKFLSVFVVASAILFLPTLNMILGFSHSLLVGTNLGDIGGGLTYWSIALMVPIEGNTAIATSAALGILFLILVFWEISKTKFEHEIQALASTQLACILAIFLSYRIIPEQFFVWALPYIIILSSTGKVEEILYRAPSLIALIYSITNALLPFYMLPLTPWIGDQLAQTIRIIQPLRIRAAGPEGTLAISTPRICIGSVFLTVLGVTFSILMVIILIESFSKERRKILTNLLPGRLNTILCKVKLQVED